MDGSASISLSPKSYRRASIRRADTTLSGGSSSTGTGSLAGLHSAPVFGRTLTSTQSGGAPSPTTSDKDSKRIDPDQADLCQALLRSIEEESYDPDQINQEFSKPVMFKNRPLTRCNVLHYAIIESASTKSGGPVTAVVEAKADIAAKAMYASMKTHPDGKQVVYETELEAVHIAAGLGHIPALEALLTASASDAEDLVCRSATVNLRGNRHRHDFYQPIHDAAYLGQKDAVLWLLDHKAEADAANKDGNTPLHFIALVGGRDGLMNEEVEEVVSELLNRKANLDARSYGPQDPNPCDKFLQEKLPLEIAAETQYPKELLYLMAASYQSTDLDTPRAFSDILLLSRCNLKVAEDFTRDLVERAKADQGLMDMLIKEAQLSGGVDKIAALLYVVPFAGAEILDALCVKPIIQDAARHPLPARTWLQSGPLRCAYQDGTAKVRGLTWPRWEFNAEVDAAHQKQLAWHKKFVPKIVGDIRQDNVYDVDVKVLLLPNVLDVDILMALTRTWETHGHVFSKLPIQGVIYCLWDQLVLPVFTSSWLFLGIDLGVLLHWGVRPNSEGNSLQNVHRYWAILLGGAVREGLNLLWWFLAHWSKWYSHDDLTMKSLWHPTVFFTDAWFLSSCLTLTCRSLLVLPCVYDHFMPSRDPVMTEWEQGLLAINVFVQGFAVTYMLRLLHRFKRILAIFKTFFSRTILEMLLIAAMVFGSFSFAFVTLIRREDAAWTVTYLYRGLMFGDGTGLDNLGLSLGENEKLDNKIPLAMFMFCGTILFNVTVLNLVIAVYGNEYDRVNSETELHFIKERAKYCLIYVEMLHKQRLLHMVEQMRKVSNSEGIFLAGLFKVLSQSLLAFLELQRLSVEGFRFFQRFWSKLHWTIALAIAAAILAAAPSLICELVPLFLDTLPLVSAFTISALEVAWQAMLIQADWFVPDAPELAPGVAVAKVSGEDAGIIEGQDGEKWRVKLTTPKGQQSYLESSCKLEIQSSKFLWICHRSDYNEKFFYGSEDVSREDLEHIGGDYMYMKGD
eukprot:s2976_g1.t1